MSLPNNGLQLSEPVARAATILEIRCRIRAHLARAEVEIAAEEGGYLQDCAQGRRIAYLDLLHELEGAATYAFLPF